MLAEGEPSAADEEQGRRGAEETGEEQAIARDGAHAAGRRTCVGMAFAGFEMRIVLATLLSRATLRVAPGAKVRGEFRGITIAPSDDLRVVVERVIPAVTGLKDPKDGVPAAVTPA